MRNKCEKDNENSFRCSIWRVYKPKMDTMSDLILANVEALATSASVGWWGNDGAV